PDRYVLSDELRSWCQRNRNRCYIPEWLLDKWGIPVDPPHRLAFMFLAPQRHSRKLSIAMSGMWRDNVEFTSWKAYGMGMTEVAYDIRHCRALHWGEGQCLR